MKRLFLLLSVVLLASCYSKQSRTWVFDKEGDFTPAQIAKFDSLFASHEKKTTNEMALVTTPDFGADKTIERFGINVARKYGVGKKDVNNGIVVVLSLTRRQVRISTGYGTERVLSNSFAQQIIDSVIIPKIKQDSVFTGVWNGCQQIVSFLEKPENKIQ